MITRFEVENYKSIKRLSLDMKPFMVLVGPNGAGKTNVVQALALFGEIMVHQSSAPVAEQGWSQVIHREKKPARSGLRLSATMLLTGPTKDAASRPDTIEVRLSVLLKGRVDDSEVAVTEEEILLRSKSSELRVKRCGEREVVDFGTDPWLWTALFTSVFLEAARMEPMTRKEAEARYERVAQPRLMFEDSPGDLALIPRFPLSRFVIRRCRATRIRLDTSSLRSDQRIDARPGVSLGSNGEGLAAVVHRLKMQKGARFDSILTALREVYPRIVDVVPEPFAGGRFTLNFAERGIADPIPLDGVSDGVLHALAILVALETGFDGFLAIEEPENAIHPWSLRKIVERCQDAPRRQGVILTTHSETVVDAIHKPESLFIVEGDERTGTTVTPAPTKERALNAILRESGQKLGDVWLGGSLGGVPQ